jgi:hypothetical protein
VQRYENQRIESYLILLFVHPAEISRLLPFFTKKVKKNYSLAPDFIKKPKIYPSENRVFASKGTVGDFYAIFTPSKMRKILTKSPNFHLTTNINF